MTAALVAIPACTSKNLSKNIFQYSLGGADFRRAKLFNWNFGI